MLPTGLLQPAPPGGFPQTAPNIWAIASSLDDKLKAPYTINLNFSMEREIKNGLVIQAAYVGRLSRRSIIGDDVAIPTNLKDPASGQTYFQAATIMEQQVAAGVPTAKIAKQPFFENFYSPYAGKGLSATQQIYDQFYTQEPDATSVLLDIDGPGCSPCGRYGAYQQWNAQYSSLAVYRSRGSGSYHSLQLTARKRFTTAFYSISTTHSRNRSIYPLLVRPMVRRARRSLIPGTLARCGAVSDYDVRHVVTAYMVYELPFGRGKRFADTSNRVVDAFVGGWQLNGIYRQTSGLPVSVGNGGFWPTNWNISGNATQLIPYTAGTVENAQTKGGGAYLFANPTAAFNAFGLTLPGQSGSRNTLRGDGVFNIDASVTKNFTMFYNENHKLQFRVESFNVTNSVRFDVGNGLSLNLGAPSTFGKYSQTLGSPRVMQFGAKYYF